MRRATSHLYGNRPISNFDFEAVKQRINDAARKKNFVRVGDLLHAHKVGLQAMLGTSMHDYLHATYLLARYPQDETEPSYYFKLGADACFALQIKAIFENRSDVVAARVMLMAPLHKRLLLALAVRLGRLSVVQVLLDAKVAITPFTHKEKVNSAIVFKGNLQLSSSPWLMAVQYHRRDLMLLLEDKGAPLDEVCTPAGVAIFPLLFKGEFSELKRIFNPEAYPGKQNQARYKQHLKLVLTVLAMLGDTELIDFYLPTTDRGTWLLRVLHPAIAAGQLTLVEVLIAQGAPINTLHRGWSALMIAAESGYVDIVVALLEAGAEIPQRTKAGRTAFQIAANAGNLEVLYCLLRAGAQTDLTPVPFFPWEGCLQASTSQQDFIHALLTPTQLPPHLFAPKALFTGMHDLVWRGDINAIRLLHQQNPRAMLRVCERTQLTPRQLAEQCGRREVVEFFKHLPLSERLEVAISQHRYMDAIMLTQSCADYLCAFSLDVYKRLLLRGVALAYLGGIEVWALEPALLHRVGTDYNFPDLLSERADLAKDATFLHRACALGHREVAEKLLAQMPLEQLFHGFPPGRGGWRNIPLSQNPFTAVIRNFHYGLFELLCTQVQDAREFVGPVDRAALMEDSKAIDAALRPLRQAATRSHKASERYQRWLGRALCGLSMRGCVAGLAAIFKQISPANKAQYLSEALYAAARNQRTEVAQWLLRQHADPNWLLSEDSGDTPLKFAVETGSLEMVALLVSHRANVNYRDESGETALHVAAKVGHRQVMHFLLSAGARVTEASWRLFPWPLLEQDAEFAVSCATRTPWLEPRWFEAGALFRGAHDLVWRHRTESIARVLQEQPAELYGVCPHTGLTPLALAEQCGHDDIVALLGEREQRAEVVRAPSPGFHAVG